MKTKITAFKYVLFSFLMLFNQAAFAQTANLTNLFNIEMFSTGLTYILGAVAILQWFEYWNSFDPSSPFIPAIKPATITFMAFNWHIFAEMVGLLGSAA